MTPGNRDGQQRAIGKEELLGKIKGSIKELQLNKTSPDKESFWEKLTMGACIKHVLFLSHSHARVKFGRASGGFPHGHSHLMNSLYL